MPCIFDRADCAGLPYCAAKQSHLESLVDPQYFMGKWQRIIMPERKVTELSTATFNVPWCKLLARARHHRRKPPKISDDIQEGCAFSISNANFSALLRLRLSFRFQFITRDSHALVEMELGWAAILSCSWSLGIFEFSSSPPAFPDLNAKADYQ